MTSINTLVADDVVHMVSDGGWTDLATGRLIDIRSKVIELPALKSAFATIGGAWVGPFIEQWLAQQILKGYDDLVDAVRKNLPSIVKMVAAQVPGAPKSWGEFVVVFTGHDGAPRADLLHGKTFANGALVVRRIPAPAWAAIPTAARLDPADIEASAIALMNMQRAVQGAGNEPSAVAGFVEVTTIGADGITRRVVHRYDDRVGERAAATLRDI